MSIVQNTHTHTHTHIYKAQSSLFYSTHVTIVNANNIIVQHKQIYCTAQSSLLYSKSITIEQQIYHYCTAQTSLLYSTDITVLQHNGTEIFVLNCKFQTSSFQSSERGSPVTFFKFICPSGHFIPPLLVFPRKYMKVELMNDSLPGSPRASRLSVWINIEIFTQWFFHFFL